MIAVFGNLTIDDIVFPDGTTRWAVPGGGAAYAALGAALWSSSIVIVAPLGADYPIHQLPGSIDLSRSPRIAHSLRNWGLYEEDGRRHFISRHNSRNWVDFCTSPEDVPSGLHAAHLAPMPQDRALVLATELRRKDTRLVSLDMDNHDLSSNPDKELTYALIRAVDLFFPSLADAERIVGESDPVAALRRLREIAPDAQLLGVKCAGKGVFLHPAGARECFNIPAIPVDVRDVTGAGDAFCGGALAGYAHTSHAVEAVQRGLVSAAFCVEQPGLNGLLQATPAQAASRLKNQT